MTKWIEVFRTEKERGKIKTVTVFSINSDLEEKNWYKKIADLILKIWKL